MGGADEDSHDAMYRSAGAVWSGRPDRQLVAEATGLRPGTALDAGCGDGRVLADGVEREESVHEQARAAGR